MADGRHIGFGTQVSIKINPVNENNTRKEFCVPKSLTVGVRNKI